MVEKIKANELSRKKNLVKKLVKDKNVHSIVKKEMIKDLELKTLENEDIVEYDKEPM